MSPETCKVDRVAEAYGFEETASDGALDDQLLARWTGAGGRTEMGYRTLTDWFNKRLLQRTYDENGRDALGGRIDHEYEALTGDDDLLAAEVVESLRADGIDADGLRRDMVSWGTMRTHLTECLDGEKDTDRSDSDWERETVATARSVVAEKAASALSSLASRDRVRGADTASVSVQVQLSCPDCPTRVSFDVALERGYVCEQHDRRETPAVSEY